LTRRSRRAYPRERGVSVSAAGFWR
jgi:hypothetical protein